MLTIPYSLLGPDRPQGKVTGKGSPVRGWSSHVGKHSAPRKPLPLVLALWGFSAHCPTRWPAWSCLEAGPQLPRGHSLGGVPEPLRTPLPATRAVSISDQCGHTPARIRATGAPGAAVVLGEVCSYLQGCLPRWSALHGMPPSSHPFFQAVVKSFFFLLLFRGIPSVSLTAATSRHGGAVGAPEQLRTAVSAGW